MKNDNPLLSTLSTMRPDVMDLGLDRILRLLSDLGDVHKKLPPVFHVAGTNGKGSTCAFIESILMHHGLKVHKFISPHLIEYNERISLYGKNISDELLEKYIKEVKKINKDKPLSWFEASVALALYAFSRNPADAIVLEVGLGGIFDGTNVIDKPKASVITSISFDHKRILGNTLSEIAKNKAGIIKTNCPVITCKQKKSAMAVISETAKQKNSPLIAEGKDYKYSITKDGFSYCGLNNKKYALPQPSLKGDYQCENAALAIASIEKSGLIELDETKLSNAISNTHWQGRLEKITDNFITNEVWVDGAHNPDAAHEVLKYSTSYWQDKPTTIIFGMKKGKDAGDFLKYLMQIPNIKEFYITRIPEKGSSEDPNTLKEFAKKHKHNFDIKVLDLKKLSDIKLRHGRILICGSLYLIGYFLAHKDEFLKQ
jgi:dihydrofolate synthase/folylpolyglutamate synthase